MTGAGSGIGLATARAFAEAGAAVVLADKDEEPVNATASKLTAAGRDAIAVRCDVTEDAEVASMVARSASKFGRLDAAFNSAGIMQRRVDTAEIEVVRVHTEYGPEAARRGVFQGMLFGTRRLADPARLAGLDPAFFRNVLPQVPRVELRLHRGEWLLVHWYAHSDGDAVRAITRVEADGDRLTRVRNYFYTPDVLGEICAELQLPFRSNGYRYWKEA